MRNLDRCPKEDKRYNYLIQQQSNVPLLTVLFYNGINQHWSWILSTKSVLECIVLTWLNISFLFALLFSLSFLHQRLDGNQHGVDGCLQVGRELSAEGRLLICGGKKQKNQCCPLTESPQFALVSVGSLVVISEGIIRGSVKSPVLCCPRESNCVFHVVNSAMLPSTCPLTYFRLWVMAGWFSAPPTHAGGVKSCSTLGI